MSFRNRLCIIYSFISNNTNFVIIVKFLIVILVLFFNIEYGYASVLEPVQCDNPSGHNWAQTHVYLPNLSCANCHETLPTSPEQGKIDMCQYCEHLRHKGGSCSDNGFGGRGTSWSPEPYLNYLNSVNSNNNN